MNKVILQFWEESERGWGVRPDGCSLHLSIDDTSKYIRCIYEGRDPNHVPDEYDRTCGEPITVYICNILFEKIKKAPLRLSQHEYSNLKKMEEIILEEDYIKYLMINN